MDARPSVVLVDPLLSGRGLIDAARGRGHAVVAVIDLHESLVGHVELPAEGECDLVLLERDVDRVDSILRAGGYDVRAVVPGLGSSSPTASPRAAASGTTTSRPSRRGATSSR